MEDDIFNFLQEDQSVEETHKAEGYWKILIVDDEKSVHDVTYMILGNFEFEGKPLTLMSAYNEEEARKIIEDNPDLALVLLDVVMSSDDSGLKLVEYIRNEIKNKIVRIILRTGQPGLAPKRKVIVEYDINDYKLKTELTADKLFVTIVSALRSFSDLQILDYNRKGLEKIVDSSSNLFKQQPFREFISGVLIQMTSLMHLDTNAVYCRTSGISAVKDDKHFIIESGIGDFSNLENKDVEEVLDKQILDILYQTLRDKRNLYTPHCLTAYFKSKSGFENIILINSSREINQWDKNLITIFCTNISAALDNLYLMQAIDDTQKDIIYTLGEVAEARSRETGSHVKRVAEISRIIAEGTGMEQRDVDLITLASPMHDLGKLTIPDSILNKPGVLSQSEMDFIHTHSQAGFDMLKNIDRPILNTAAIISLEHHEKFDGTGYPLGKKGDEISLFGRIVAIADVYDALGSDRVYKKAWPEEQIIQYFHDNRGTFFDPELVDIFMKRLNQIRALRETYPD